VISSLQYLLVVDVFAGYLPTTWSHTWLDPDNIEREGEREQLADQKPFELPGSPSFVSIH
jgi:hypothetical protein